MAEQEDRARQWAGFSDYENVASQLHKDINRAIKAYSHVDSKDKQSIGVTPKTALKTRSAILSITKRLAYEVKLNRNIDELDEVRARWFGLDEDGEDDPSDDGSVARLERADFTESVPGWLGQHVDDIVTAGCQLGYLKAGVEKRADPETPEEEVEAMFE